jgi:hypothetical protein
MAEEIVNKVAKANIVQIDLSNYLPKKNIVSFDIKQALWQGLIVKEKEFRSFVKTFDWEVYKNKTVALFCSEEAIIPAWAFMLISTELLNVNAVVYYGKINEVKEQLFFYNLAQLNAVNFKGSRVMVKGCSDIPNPIKAYVELTKKLVPVVKSLMFGEPCSAVPVFKAKK